MTDERKTLDPAAAHALGRRVEDGESGSGINAEIMAMFYRRENRFIGATDENDVPLQDGVWVDPLTNGWVSTHAYEFTSSLDAIERLRVRRFPKWPPIIRWQGGREGDRCICQQRYAPLGSVETDASTEIAARLSALLQGVAHEMRRREAGL